MACTLSTLTTLFFIALVQAQIGPTGDLVISNVEVSPDGYSRTTALANGVVDGGPITGTKVAVSRNKCFAHL